ncbi:MAG: hypothetical protein WC891_04380 [Actinomycetota bacterium]
MDQSKKTITAASVMIIAFLSAIVAVALVQNPPTEVKPHDHAAEQAGQQSDQASVLEATLDEIDPKATGTLSLVVQGNNNEEAAKKLTEALHSQFEGFIGKVTIDLSKQTFVLEYDTTKLTEDKLLIAIGDAGYKAEKTPAE